jgi:hypothetical protein
MNIAGQQYNVLTEGKIGRDRSSSLEFSDKKQVFERKLNYSARLNSNYDPKKFTPEINRRRSTTTSSTEYSPIPMMPPTLNRKLSEPPKMLNSNQYSSAPFMKKLLVLPEIPYEKDELGVQEQAPLVSPTYDKVEPPRRRETLTKFINRKKVEITETLLTRLTVDDYDKLRDIRMYFNLIMFEIRLQNKGMIKCESETRILVKLVSNYLSTFLSNKFFEEFMTLHQRVILNDIHTLLSEMFALVKDNYTDYDDDRKIGEAEMILGFYNYKWREQIDRINNVYIGGISHIIDYIKQIGSERRQLTELNRMQLLDHLTYRRHCREYLESGRVKYSTKTVEDEIRLIETILL